MLDIIAKIQSGSHLYGLNTPDSDLDYYSVGLNTQMRHILGLDRHEHEISMTENKDSTCFELRRFLNLCRKATTHAYELLNTPSEKFEILDSEFKRYVLDHKTKFMDTEKLFKCLMGYLNGEIRATFGETTGKLGDKRKAQIEKYGFSPKNACNAARLALSGINFFKNGEYIVNFSSKYGEIHEMLKNIKCKPGAFTKEELKDILTSLENSLKAAFDSRDKSKDLTFDEEYANYVVWKIYAPRLNPMRL